MIQSLTARNSTSESLTLALVSAHNSAPFLSSDDTWLICCIQPPGKTTTWPNGSNHRLFVLPRFFLALHGTTVLMCGGSLALYVLQTIISSSTHKQQIYELLQGRVLFRGRSGPKNAWTAEEDQLAQMIELFGPIPASVRKRGRLSSKYFDENGKCLESKSPCIVSNLGLQVIYCTSSSYIRTHCEIFLRKLWTRLCR